ncbi:quinone-dependent dihydroorotate dehydrogenase [Nocardioides sp.]|uniref:quinone-dependent dihydroorotate dehydrogenase n=1 Tax=Nocardioides sp. TaxID=35761 RepID=UPI002CA44C72|nr:quinone-dependent dihydroorotate dehydrogenase [Nocardioides sp.]HSX67795.1 quinone-dependent dihydroorotate dehydrogenase [Nocardioides sp.]
MKKPYDVLFDGVFSKLDPEKAHEQAFAAIRAGRVATGAWNRTLKARPVTAMGITFPNVLGLAAGFDKNAVGIDALAGLGFGHIEVGTVTGEAQPGNPKPRLFRLLDDRAVVNRMGFNNDGAEIVGRRLAARAAARKGKPGPVVGVNIGKTKVVPDDDIAAVIKDHEKSVDHLAPYADYLVVNVSSPNTPGLRNLQAVEKLAPLLEAVRTRADQVVTDRRVPLVVKIAPDLNDDDVLAVADMAKAIGLDGITATNTTISRDGLRSPQGRIEEIGAGGLSGRPLTQRSLEVLRLLKGRVGDDLTLIGVGGVTTVEDARARLDAGADLLQGYTAFIYEGPLWPRRILRGVPTTR